MREKVNGIQVTDNDDEAVLPMRIDPSSPIPLYHQVSDAILDAIHRGRFSYGSRLPAEAELCKLFGVSRITVRQALAGLQEEGHLVRERPRGPLIIKTAPIEHRTAELSSVLLDPLLQGHEPRFILREARRIQAEHLARDLEVDTSAQIIRIDRILVDEIAPLAILASFIPESRCPDLLDQELSQSLLKLLEDHYGHRFVSATQRLSARRASEYESGLLHLPSRTPVIQLNRLTRTADTRPIEYLECVLRADRYEFVMDLTR